LSKDDAAGVSIRPARRGDEAAIAKVEVAFVQASRRDIYEAAYLASLSLGVVTAEVGDALRDEEAESRLWVAERSGNVVAFVQTERWREGATQAPTAFLANLYVEPSLFRQRIGSRLLHFVERELIATGFRTRGWWKTLLPRSRSTPLRAGNRPDG
jgi:predicted N-acetyltransferase YhbS